MVLTELVRLFDSSTKSTIVYVFIVLSGLDISTRPCECLKCLVSANHSSLAHLASAIFHCQVENVQGIIFDLKLIFVLTILNKAFPFLIIKHSMFIHNHPNISCLEFVLWPPWHHYTEWLHTGMRFFIARKLIKLQNKRCFLHSILPINFLTQTYHCPIQFCKVLYSKLSTKLALRSTT